MKDASIGNRSRKRRRLYPGSVTLEILLAFAIMTLTMTAVIQLVFSNQSAAIDTAIHAQLIARAADQLERVRAGAARDFYMITSTSTTESHGPLTFVKNLTVTATAPFTKEAVSTVSWAHAGRTLSVDLALLLVDPYGPLGADTCSPVPSGNWRTPVAASAGYGFFDLPAAASTTGIDVSGGRAYVVTDLGPAADPDFYIVDVRDVRPAGGSLPILGSLTTTYGLTDIRVSGSYAYATVDSTGAQPQLLVISIADPAHPSIVGKKRLTPVGSSFANTLFYDYRTRLAYVGTNTSSGDEFYIVDVSSPSAPVTLGSFPINAKVNQIVVDGTTAYLATASTSDVIMLDVSNAASPTLMRISALPGIPTTKSLLLSGAALYVGRFGGGVTAHSSPQLFSLRASDLSMDWSLTTASVGHYNGVNRMIRRSNLLFVAADSAPGGFEIYDVSDPLNAPARYDTTPLVLPQGTTQGFDCEGNYFFIGGSGNRLLQIIGPTE